MERKILIDVERQRDTAVGVGYFCLCLERGLRHQHIQGAKLRYYGVSRPGRRCAVKYRPWHKWVSATSQGYDLLHITYLLQRYIKPARSSRCILTIHDMMFLRELGNTSTQIKKLRQAQRNIAAADVIVCSSRYVWDTLEQYRHLFSFKPHARIELIYNGICLPRHLARKIDCSRFASLVSTPFLLMSGVLSVQNQQHLLLEMLTFLPEEFQLVLLYSDSQPEYVSKIIALVDRLGIGKRIHLLEDVSPKERIYLMEHCLAYLHPTVAEGFIGVPAIEAMSLGKPTFTSTRAALPEICGEEGYYFDSFEPEAMAEVVRLGLQDFRHDAGKAERLAEWASRYDYEEISRQYAELYQSI